MKRLIAFILVMVLMSSLFIFEPSENNAMASEEPSLTVRVESNNKIVVSWQNVSKDLINSDSVAVQLRSQSDPGTGTTFAYHYIDPVSSNIAGYEAHSTQDGTSGSVTFSSEYAGSENRKANFPLKDGGYYVILRKANGSLLQNTRVDFTVGPKPTLMLDTHSFSVGNNICVSWVDVSKEILNTSNDISVQIRNSSGESLAYHYIDPVSSNIAGYEAHSTQDGTSGSVTFSNEYAGSENRKKNFPLAPGEYYIILRLSNGSLKEETRVDFVVEPTQKISLEKQVFEYGDSIPVNYSGMSGVGNVAIRVYRSGYTVGVSGSEAYVVMTDASGNALYGESGTLSFMEADERPADADNKVYFLPAGSYELVMVILGTNEVYGKTVAFEVTNVTGKIMAAAPELKEAITIHYIAHIDQNISATDVSMKFKFKDQEFVVAGIPGEQIGQKIVYTFPLTDILPQDMGENISAELYAGTALLDAHDAYSIQQYCVNKLADTDDAVLKTLLVSLLNYGAEAQKYFDANVENLVTDVLTEEQQGYVSNFDMTQVEGVVATPVDSSLNKGDYTWISATLGLYDTIKIRVKFYAETIDGLQIVVDEKPYTDFISVGNNLYYVYIPVYANCFDVSYSICFQNAEGQQGCVLTYSVNTYIYYIANRTSSVTNIVQAICNYGVAVKNYSLA